VSSADPGAPLIYSGLESRLEPAPAKNGLKPGLQPRTPADDAPGTGTNGILLTPPVVAPKPFVPNGTGNALPAILPPNAGATPLAPTGPGAGPVGSPRLPFGGATIQGVQNRTM
jgi:hypothetical protein